MEKSEKRKVTESSPSPSPLPLPGGEDKGEGVESSNLAVLTRELRREILNISYRAKVGHVGSALSIIDILAVLYFRILKIDPKNPQEAGRDRFLLSKGHAASALYTVLSRRGFFSKEELDTFCQDGTRLAVHPEDTSLPGIEYASGSLGHGLSFGTGLALGGKKEKNPFRVFVLMSDAECDEGSIWEAAMFASHHRLDNLTAVIDYNQSQALGNVSEILSLEPFQEKWKSFGWQVEEIDGHDLAALEGRLSRLPLQKDKPSVFIARTALGKGVSFMENKLDWHYLTMTEDQYQKALSLL